MIYEKDPRIKDLHHAFIGISAISLVYQLQGVNYILKCSTRSNLKKKKKNCDRTHSLSLQWLAK